MNVERSTVGTKSPVGRTVQSHLKLVQSRQSLTTVRQEVQTNHTLAEIQRCKATNCNTTVHGYQLQHYSARLPTVTPNCRSYNCNAKLSSKIQTTIPYYQGYQLQHQIVGATTVTPNCHQRYKLQYRIIRATNCNIKLCRVQHSSVRQSPATS